MKCAMGKDTAQLLSFLPSSNPPDEMAQVCTFIGTQVPDRGSATLLLFYFFLFYYIEGIFPEGSCGPFVTVGEKLHHYG